MRLRKALVPVALLTGIAALAVAAVATAHSTQNGRTAITEQVRYRHADQALARSVVLKLADLGTPRSWRGGQTSPSNAQPRTCAGFQPRVAELVVTGDAASDFRQASGAMVVHNEVQILQTVKMANLDWRMNVVAPAALACLRSFLADSISSSEHLVSFRRMSVPRVAAHTAAFRATIAVDQADGSVQQTLLDVIFAGTGRTEITLETTAPATSGTQAARSEAALARTLVARASHA